MNWDAVGAIAELLGAIGVVASLIYLATQISQSNNAMRAAAHQEAITSLRDLNRNLLGHDLVELFRQGAEDSQSLTDSERARFSVLTMDMLRSFESVHNQYLMGMLDRGAWEGWLRFIGDYCTAPGVQWYWGFRQDTFSPAFRALFESFDPHPDQLRLEALVSRPAEADESQASAD